MLTSDEKICSFINGYIVAALWSSTDNSDESGGNPLDDNYDEDDIDPASLAQIAETCGDFVQGNMGDLLLFCEQLRSFEDSAWRSAGHDFWLTRNSHGAGFWDRGLEDLGDRLTKAAKVYSGCDITVGDDGKLYFS